MFFLNRIIFAVMPLEIKPLLSDSKQEKYMVIDLANMRMFVGDLNNSLDTFNLWNKGQFGINELEGSTFEFEIFKDEDKPA